VAGPPASADKVAGSGIPAGIPKRRGAARKNAADQAPAPEGPPQGSLGGGRYGAGLTPAARARAGVGAMTLHPRRRRAGPVDSWLSSAYYLA
jgi:hypothetical protein